MITISEQSIILGWNSLPWTWKPLKISAVLQSNPDTQKCSSSKRWTFIQFEKVSQQNKSFSDVTIFKRRTLLRSFKAINLIIKLNSTILKGWIIILPEMVSWWSSWSLIGQIVGCLRLDITVSQTRWLLLRFRNIWRNRLFEITIRNRNRHHLNM